MHTCKKYSRNRTDAHLILLKALQSICYRAGYTSTMRKNPESRGKRPADLFIKGIKLAVRKDMVVDVSVVHEFHGDVMQNVSRSKATKKVNKYRNDNKPPDRSDRPKAFLPAIMSTSGCIQGCYCASSRTAKPKTTFSDLVLNPVMIPSPRDGPSASRTTAHVSALPPLSAPISSPTAR